MTISAGGLHLGRRSQGFIDSKGFSWNLMARCWRFDFVGAFNSVFNALRVQFAISEDGGVVSIRVAALRTSTFTVGPAKLYVNM
jgi:hypothetical protein